MPDKGAWILQVEWRLDQAGEHGLPNSSKSSDSVAQAHFSSFRAYTISFHVILYLSEYFLTSLPYLAHLYYFGALINYFYFYFSIIPCYEIET